MMECVKTENGYDFWTGYDGNGDQFFNIIPANSPPPLGGYYDREYIENIKHQTF